MSISWRYDVLFSFQITYTENLNSNDFILKPSISCKRLLKKHNLIFKETENGGLIICEKRVFDDGSKEAIWKIKELIGFTFILELRNLALIGGLKPYSSDPVTTYPEKYGIQRLLYLDNLNDTLDIDQNATVVGPFMDNMELITLRVSNEPTVSGKDLASTVPNIFEYQRTAGINGINIRPINPSENAPIAISLSDSKPKAKIDLQQGAYLFEQVGSGKPVETIFSADELLSETPLAVIQIYKDESTNYSRSVRYTIDFEKP